MDNENNKGKIGQRWCGGTAAVVSAAAGQSAEIRGSRRGQYSAQKEYWDAVQNFVGSAPSALQLMMPEAWLGKNQAHAQAVPGRMEQYLTDGTLREIGEGMMFFASDHYNRHSSGTGSVTGFGTV